jgi:hypothetical protein
MIKQQLQKHIGSQVERQSIIHVNESSAIGQAKEHLIAIDFFPERLDRLPRALSANVPPCPANYKSTVP